MKKESKRKGFTLSELIVSIIIMAMVGLIIGLIFNTAFAGRDLLDREASIQAEMRSNMQRVSKTVENATGIFIVDQNFYKAVNPKETFVGTKGWDYIGLSKDGTKLMQHIYNEETETWESSVIGGYKSTYDLNLSLKFTTVADTTQQTGGGIKDYEDNRLIKYELTGSYKDSKDKSKVTNKLDVETAIMALNSKQLFSKVSQGNDGIALAYRNTPITGNTNAAISFIFDTSGSMNWNMQGRPLANNGENPNSRIASLESSAKKMMKKLADPGTVSINLARFATLGGYINSKAYTMLKSDQDLQAVNTTIDGLSRITGGVTNPGDGLRYGMVSLAEQSATNKYIVILSDGRPNQYNITARGDLDVSDPTVRGYSARRQGNTDYHPTSVTYVGAVAEAWAKKSGAKELYFIGFSGLASDKQYGQTMADLITSKGLQAHYEDARDSSELDKVFDKIVNQVLQDLWFVNGPKEVQ